MAPAAPSPSAVSLRDAVALSGRFPLLAGVDLEVAVGETVLVEGPNGAGKTSLLRVCAGLVPLASGRLTVLGLDPVRQRTAVRRRVGLLSHASHLYDDLTVQENVRFAVRAAGGDPARIAPACDRWGLTGRLARTPATKLSAGQRRRVALAVLTARWPEVWLLDEPHAGLDAAARALLDEAVAEASAARVTILIASHESGVVEDLAHRAVTVTGGRVTAGRVLGAPASPDGITRSTDGPGGTVASADAPDGRTGGSDGGTRGSGDGADAPDGRTGGSDGAHVGGRVAHVA
ncbi:MAG TPA: heme ABC exporter ATP-binding protein CcmA [Acidimicrobiales bacterium]|nr:heme ABC exporter ATP-binding protein CcmA [Acidimicrobiales bacterium]